MFLHDNETSFLTSCFFILLLCANTVECKSSDNKTNPLQLSERKATEDAAECVLELSAKYFVEKRALSGSIVIININSWTSTTEKILLQTLHGGLKYSIMVKDSLFPHRNASHFPEKAKNYMLVLEKKSELTRNILQLNKLPTWNPHAKCIVFYSVESEENITAIVIDIINTLRDHKVFKSIVLIYKSDSNAVTAYTWRPYSDTNCGGRCDSVYILDVCLDNRVVQHHAYTNMFPLNMKGCPLVAYAVVCEPYVLPPVRKINTSNFSDEYEFNLGIEINLLKIISHFTNMTLIMRMSDTAENWGDISMNGTATGAYGMLRNESADVIIGNMHVTRIIRRWFDPSNTFMQDEITWCVPKAGPASTWCSLVSIFTWSTWLATFVALIFMGSLLHLFYYKENVRAAPKSPTKSILMALSMILGWSGQFKPRSSTFRILIVTWLMFGINLSVSYESFLRIFLIHPKYEKQIRNEDDMIKSGLRFGGQEIYKSYFESSADMQHDYIYKNYKSTSYAEGITSSALDKQFAVVSSRRQADYEDYKLTKGRALIYCFQENDILYKYGLVILARKWFPMLNRFNTIIRSVSENGLIWKWNKEVFTHSSAEPEASDIVPLGMRHMLGAFLFITFMYGVCLIVFLCEILFFKAQNQMKLIRYRKMKKFSKLLNKNNSN